MQIKSYLRNYWFIIAFGASEGSTNVWGETIRCWNQIVEYLLSLTAHQKQTNKKTRKQIFTHNKYFQTQPEG